MQFLPKNKKKTLWLAIIFIIAIGGIIYLNFGWNRQESSSPEPAVQGPVQTGSGGPVQESPVSAIGEDVGPRASQPEISGFPPGLLPFGETIDMKVLTQERFRALKAAPAISVSGEELGKDNPFSSK